jgi:hypothetical protein
MGFFGKISWKIGWGPPHTMGIRGSGFFDFLSKKKERPMRPPC